MKAAQHGLQATALPLRFSAAPEAHRWALTSVRIEYVHHMLLKVTMKKSAKTKKPIAVTIRERPKLDKKREERIAMEIIVDAYTPEEQAMGWYYYLDEQLHFPVLATCISERAISPLHKGDEVEMIEMAPEEECEQEMFVKIRWERKGLAVPLVQLKPVDKMDKETKQAISDWHYWVAQGYEL